MSGGHAILCSILILAALSGAGCKTSTPSPDPSGSSAPQAHQRDAESVSERLPGHWATTVGPVGSQWVYDIVVDTDGTTHALADITHECGAEPTKGCAMADPRVQVLVAYDRLGDLVYEQRRDPKTDRALAMTQLADGRIALLTDQVDPDGRTARGSPRLRIHDRADGSLVHSLMLDLDVDVDAGRWHMAPSADGGLVLAGVFTGTLRVGTALVESSSDEWDVFVVHVDASGRPSWHVTARGFTPRLSGQDTVEALHVSASGDVTITGGCRGRPLRVTDGTRTEQIRCGGKRRDDAYVLRIGGDGALRWVRRLASSFAESRYQGFGAKPKALAEGPDDSIFVLGIFADRLELVSGETKRVLLGRGHKDTFLVHYGREGDVRQAWQLGGPGQDRFNAMVAHGDHLWLTGTVAGDDALADLRPSTVFEGHDSTSLRLPNHGVLVALRPSDGAHAHIVLPAEPVSPMTGVRPQLLALAPDGLRLAGSFAAERASFPHGGGRFTSLLRRMSQRENYESFLWAPAWEELAAGVLLPRDWQ